MSKRRACHNLSTGRTLGVIAEERRSEAAWWSSAEAVVESFAQIGEKLMFKWAVPEIIAQAVGHHRDTKEGIEQLTGQARSHARVTARCTAG